MRKVLIIVTVLLLLILSIFGWVQYNLNQKISLSESLTIHIPKGMSLDEAINIFNSYKIFEPSWLYKIIIRSIMLVENKKIIAGNYLITDKMSQYDIIKALLSGKSQNVVRVTFPEGIQLTKFAEIAEEKIGINKNRFLELANSPDFLEKFGIDATSAEGYLMPETYDFFINQSEESVLAKLINQQNKIWNQHFAERAKELNMSRHEVLTLASIIEAETPVAEERARVSGVYHNRLKRGMLLQADPTVQYALGIQRRLKYSDLSYNNRYNTYIYPGLPPGPINSPSFKSIEAALYPEEHNYIYFVAIGDGSGRHNFSSTEEGHQKNRIIYKRNLRANKNRPLLE